MKNLITIILFVGAYCNTPLLLCGADSTVVVSKKHKRVLKQVSSIQSPPHNPQLKLGVMGVTVSKIDTFIDNDKDGINDLRKKDEKNALFRFLDEKASSYVSAKGGAASGGKEKNTKTEELSPPEYKNVTLEQKVKVKELSPEQKELPSKKVVKLKKATRK